MLMIGVAALELAHHEKSWLRAPGVAGVLLFARAVDRLVQFDSRSRRG
jgi:hypothetical protein